MGRLIYSMLVSLDGYVADEGGRFGWATPDDEVEPIVFPVLVGGGTRFFPDGVPLELELRDTRRFARGAVALTYAVRRT